MKNTQFHIEKRMFLGEDKLIKLKWAVDISTVWVICSTAFVSATNIYTASNSRRLNVHTPIEFYVKLPVDLFRGGTPTKPKFDYLRMLPPRKNDETYDVKINLKTGLIDHKSGGLSLFNAPNYSFGSDWWIVPAGTKLPPEFTLSKDLTSGKFKGHYTVRALVDMSVHVWKKKLREWAEEHAINNYEYRKVKNNV